MITKRDIAIVNNPLLVTCVARELGTVDVSKIICLFDETVISTFDSMLIKRGNPLLDRFNILMRKYVEAGFRDRLWAELKHLASLRGGGRLVEKACDGFFAFSISHLMPTFDVLIVGTVLSSAVFIAELIVKCLYKRRGKVGR